MKRDGKKLSENRDNPVVIGNAAIWGIGIIAIGYGAYKKHSEGQLDWKLAGTVAGVVGAFGVADYFASQYVLLEHDIWR
jgi:pyruvate dehydrogenase E2 component (dihydrolipoamide acetyltransferase)